MHFKRRALERYGLELGRSSQQEIITMIQENKAEFQHRTSLRASVFIVDYNDKKIRVVYDNKRKTLVTALPLEDTWNEGQVD